jgi:chemotaxis methyl-accepting protein methylase
LSAERQTPTEHGTESPVSDFVKLLEYLKRARGFDFSGYKLSGLVRRVQKRMQQVGVASYGEYVDFLEVHPDEFLPLFNTVLINVTGFFRDPEAWRALAERILPRILESKGAGEPIRCWSAGCASGEEAYTLAILLAEALGDDELRQRVKIYATDADEEALAQARQGSYSAAQVEDVPEALRARYFEPAGERYVFRPDLRRSLIFGRHDLVQDAAISRLDLLVCRNTLMYFNVEAQGRILSRFHFALGRGGYLFLGKAETLLSHNNSFRLPHRARLLAGEPARPAVQRPGSGLLGRPALAGRERRPLPAHGEAGPGARQPPLLRELPQTGRRRRQARRPDPRDPGEGRGGAGVGGLAASPQGGVPERSGEGGGTRTFTDAHRPSRTLEAGSFVRARPCQSVLVRVLPLPLARPPSL